MRAACILIETQAYCFVHPGAARFHVDDPFQRTDMWLEIRTDKEGILLVAPLDERTRFEMASFSHVVPKLLAGHKLDHVFEDRVYDPKVCLAAVCLPTE